MANLAQPMSLAPKHQHPGVFLLRMFECMSDSVIGQSIPADYKYSRVADNFTQPLWSSKMFLGTQAHKNTALVVNSQRCEGELTRPKAQGALNQPSLQRDTGITFSSKTLGLDVPVNNPPVMHVLESEGHPSNIKPGGRQVEGKFSTVGPS